MSDLEPPHGPEEEARDSAKLRAALVLIATLAFVLSPFITEPFSGFDPSQMPVPVDNPPIQPAGYAFSIWGVIYLWLLASAGFGLIKRDIDGAWDKGRWPLLVSVAIGASWIPVALAAPVLSTVLIWIMLVGAVLAADLSPTHDRRWNALPIGLYAGWLTAASAVALGTVAMGYGLGEPLTISWVALAVALVIAVLLTRRLRIVTYPIGVAWALAGIVVANISLHPMLAAAALAGGLGLLWLALRYRRPA